MAQKDIEAVLLGEVAVNTQAISSNATTDGEAIDMQGYEAVMFTLHSGVVTDGTFTPLLKEGSDSNVSNATNVADSDILPTGTGQEAAAALNSSNAVSQIGYRGDSRYVFLSVVSTAVTTGGTLGATAIKGHPTKAPTS